MPTAVILPIKLDVTMKWSNVKLILRRELKDQLRDRRTLFTVLVLPLLLYPLMGVAMLQISQFSQQQVVKIWMVGTENLPESPSLLQDGNFNPELFPAQSNQQILLDVESSDNQVVKFVKQFWGSEKFAQGEQAFNKVLQVELEKRDADLAVFFLSPIEVGVNSTEPSAAPKVMVFQNSASDKSKLAAQEFNSIISRWRQKITSQILSDNHVDTHSLSAFTCLLYTSASPRDRG